ncbi:hypothetical protein FBY34_5872 [Streptomyces sp. SLBN-115]|nr:hypothetical protein FBY34_5872 [Streptomyces sp. SLBN-115]
MPSRWPAGSVWRPGPSGSPHPVHGADCRPLTAASSRSRRRATAAPFLDHDGRSIVSDLGSVCLHHDVPTQPLLRDGS